MTEVRTGRCELKKIPNNVLELTGTALRGGQGVWRFSLMSAELSLGSSVEKLFQLLFPLASGVLWLAR